ncbi:MAG: ubiquinol-cytochrome C chaperone [Gemmatimonadetes bacterium]|nr:ubiquinol-cytochrome C chaperone [Gemmatimonadota bacterium]NIT68380.1 ubiquinol-cytochrome C chaperone [Gemmatimonadota bacterium]NIW76922.1 ubiquinol-cytochrome C chaperone [Gemmatimonadota bacterium]NIY36957.1 ubiquinol-cytochrome C chaperone [Gemmatimonadota bacterium]
MSLFPFFRRPKWQESAHRLYGRLVAQARRTEFYTALGVPDTPQGRFEMIALHAFLVLHRLKGETKAAARLSQAVFDVMFADLDQSLREMGVGDLSVGRRVKSLAQGFYGRAAAYESGLTTEDRTLIAALSRNVYATAAPTPTPTQMAAMAAYLRREAEALARQDTADFLSGRVEFGPPPGAG